MSGFFSWCNIFLEFKTNLEDLKPTSDENKFEKSSPETNIDNESKKKENVKEFTEFLEKSSTQDKKLVNEISPDKDNTSMESKSLFRRFLNNGFDGISSNPNYKMLALLVILLINLSLFFVIGNLGKVFLKNAGVMG